MRRQSEIMRAVALDVVEERVRQVIEEGHRAKHGDAHGDGDLACGAIAYLMAVVNPNGAAHWWPPGFDPAMLRPTTPRRDLVKAAALILAEIERLDRKAERAAGSAT